MRAQLRVDVKCVQPTPGTSVESVMFAYTLLTGRSVSTSIMRNKTILGQF